MLLTRETPARHVAAVEGGGYDSYKQQQPVVATVASEEGVAGAVNAG